MPGCHVAVRTIPFVFRRKPVNIFPGAAQHPRKGIAGRQRDPDTELPVGIRQIFSYKVVSVAIGHDLFRSGHHTMAHS